jgi:putative transposase
VWLYYRFNPSHRDVENLLAEWSTTGSYEAIRLWCNKFGPKYAQRLRLKHQGYGDTFFIDEVFVKIRGKQYYLRRAIDQDSEVVGVFLQKRRDGESANRFFKWLLRKCKGKPRKIITDKLKCYGVAHRKFINIPQYNNNRCELSHEPTWVRERMRKFKSTHQAQRFLGGHAAVHNLFNLGRHLVSAEHYRYFRLRAFATWKNAAAA